MTLKDGKKVVLGIEGSANKIGVGIVTEDGSILSNPRKTCVNKYFRSMIEFRSSILSHISYLHADTLRQLGKASCPERRLFIIDNVLYLLLRQH